MSGFAGAGPIRRLDSSQRSDSRSRSVRCRDTVCLDFAAGRPRADQVLLIDQPQDRHRGSPTGRVGLGRQRSADGQDRMEQEPLLAFLRAPDRAQPRHRLLAMGVGGERRVFDEQEPAGRPQFVLDQTAMSGLNPIRRDLFVPEEFVGGFDVVLLVKSSGISLPGCSAKALGVGHEALVAGLVPKPATTEVQRAQSAGEDWCVDDHVNMIASLHDIEGGRSLPP